MSIRKETLIKYNARAVKSGVDSLYGVVMINAERRGYQIVGICQTFETRDGRLRLPGGGVFFYGDIGDLQENYFNGLPAALLPRLESYVERVVKSESVAPHPYYSIPAGELCLSPNRIEILHTVMLHTEERLHDVLDKLETVDMRGMKPRMRFRFMWPLNDFPSHLINAAAKKGLYYKASVAVKL